MRFTTLLLVGSCAFVSVARSLRLGRGDDVFEMEKPQDIRGDARERAGRQYDGHIPRHRQPPVKNGGQRFGNQFPYKLGRQGQDHGRQTPRQQTQRGLNVPPPNYAHPQQRGGPGEGQNRQDGRDIASNPTNPPQSAQQNQSPHYPRPQSPFPRGNNGNTPQQQSQGPSFPGPERSASPEPNDYTSGRQNFRRDPNGYDGQGQPANNGEDPGPEVPILPNEDQDGPPRDQEIGSQSQDSQGGDALQVLYHHLSKFKLGTIRKLRLRKIVVYFTKPRNI